MLFAVLQRLPALVPPGAVLLLASTVEQQRAWSRQQNQFMVAQGQELVRLGEAVARLEQDTAMEIWNTHC